MNNIVDLHLTFAKDSGKCEEGCLVSAGVLSEPQQRTLEEDMRKMGYVLDTMPSGSIRWIKRPKEEEELTWEEILEQDDAYLREFGFHL